MPQPQVSGGMRSFQALLLGLLLLAVSVLAWEKEDHELFDLVSALEKAEGKGTTFYTFLNTTKSASLAEINKAARRRSLELHPDKHQGDKDIQDRFARLGVIASILRDPEKRERYNYFHDNGVPKWKGTGYMYSRWQPGLPVVLTFLVVVATLAQYGVQHANYRSELARIRRFQRAARQTAYGPRANTMTPTNANVVMPTAETKLGTLSRKKVKVPLSGEANPDLGDDDEATPRARRRGQGSKQGQVALITMIVEGERVWIVTEDGQELPLDASAATAPSLFNTFVPSLANALLHRAIPAKPLAEPEGHGSEVEAEEESALEDSDAKTGRKGMKRRKIKSKK